MDSQNKLDLEGRLDRHPLAELLIEISHGGLSGALRLEQDERKIVFYFEDGDLVFAASNVREHKLFEILLRLKKVTPAQLSEIKDFVNDLKLKESLLSRQLLSEEEMRNAFGRQFDLILQEIIVRNAGNWVFTPLARVRDEMRRRFDFYKLLFEYGRSFSGARALERFKSFQETFRLRKKMPEFDLQPQEAFLLSRFETGRLTTEAMRDLSGLSETETFRILYALWLGGFLKRENWNAAFSVEKLNEINSAKLTLKTSAPEMEKTEEKIAASPPTSEVTVEKEETEFTLEDYLEQIENAETLYELLDILPTASANEIKNHIFRMRSVFTLIYFTNRLKPTSTSKLNRHLQRSRRLMKHLEMRKHARFMITRCVKISNLRRKKFNRMVR